MRRFGSLWACGTAVLASFLSACGHDVAPRVDHTAELKIVAAEVLERAQQAGASQTQLDIVAASATEGAPIEFADYEDAYFAFATCMESAGLVVDGPLMQQMHGQTLVNYGIGSSPEFTEQQMFEVHNRCRTEHFGFVDEVYQSQPAAEEYIHAAFEKLRPQLLECLRGYGASLPDNALPDEFSTAQLEVVSLHGEGADCFESTGLNAALNGG